MNEPERRRHDRQISTFRLAKLKEGTREGWIFIKNLSATGMMITIHPDFDLSDKVTIILTEDQQLIGNIRWRKHAEAGIHFDGPADVAELLKRPSENKNGRISRFPRIQIMHPINLLLGSWCIIADICDISPTGICVRAEYIFEVGKRPLMVRLPTDSFYFNKVAALCRKLGGKRNGGF